MLEQWDRSRDLFDGGTGSFDRLHNNPAHLGATTHCPTHDAEGWDDTLLVA